MLIGRRLLRLASLVLSALGGLGFLGVLGTGPAWAKPLSIEEFQDLDQRLQDAGWRLVRGNAPFCADALPAVGLQLQDMASYGKPDVAQAALGLKGAFAVQTAAAGSPAALSNAFARNREIVRIGSVDPNGWETGKNRSWERLTRAHDWIDQRLAQTGAVTVTFGDGETASLKPVMACPSRFELLSNKNTAVADGGRVVIGTKFPGFGWDDSIFVGVVAHELAHNLLGHRVWLTRNSRKPSHIRRTEREADRLIPWLMANAGYDPQDAVRFMETWGKRHDPGLFRSRAYEGWDERAEHIAGEVPIVRALIEREGKADWSVYFRREIDPNQGLPEETSNEATP